jgi:hypothetical protein
MSNNPKSLANLKEPWAPGTSGNLGGRPTVRGRLTERFIGDVSSTWERHGAVILDRMALKQPDRFADLCSRLIPRDITLAVEARLPGGLSAPDWAIVMQLLEAIKIGVPNAESMQPQQVLSYTLEAIRAHSATTIEST